MPPFDVNGKVALVTGGMRGIGLETARLLHERGARVVVTDIDRDGVEQAARRLGADRALGLVADVRDEAAMRVAVEQAIERFGGLDVVVANAGVLPPLGTVLRTDLEHVDLVIDVNLRGVIHTVRAALPHLIERQGHLVIVSSVAVFINGALQGAYAVSKAGVEALGRPLRVELAQYGATTTVAYFGNINTEMTGVLFNDPMAENLKRIAPKPLLKQIPPSRAAAGIVEGIERRAAHVMLPRRWETVRLLRGIAGPLVDSLMCRRQQVQDLLREADAR